MRCWIQINCDDDDENIIKSDLFLNSVIDDSYDNNDNNNNNNNNNDDDNTDNNDTDNNNDNNNSNNDNSSNNNDNNNNDDDNNNNNNNDDDNKNDNNIDNNNNDDDNNDNNNNNDNNRNNNNNSNAFPLNKEHYMSIGEPREKKKKRILVGIIESQHKILNAFLWVIYSNSCENNYIKNNNENNVNGLFDYWGNPYQHANPTDSFTLAAFNGVESSPEPEEVFPERHCYWHFRFTCC